MTVVLAKPVASTASRIDTDGRSSVSSERMSSARRTLRTPCDSDVSRTAGTGSESGFRLPVAVFTRSSLSMAVARSCGALTTTTFPPSGSGLGRLLHMCL